MSKFIVVQNTRVYSKPEKIYCGLHSSYKDAWNWIEKNAYYHAKWESFHYTYSIIDVQSGKETFPFDKEYERPKK